MRNANPHIDTDRHCYSYRDFYSYFYCDGDVYADSYGNSYSHSYSYRDSDGYRYLYSYS
ncbi:MAG TPA: hypothetical protein VE735_02235 [Gammaproteobacteria bacterium]|jgi:hypothetical protein|nr:hypothetical protein [Gammaproteobacteria bacterium]